MHAEATVTWYAAHLAASFSRCYSYSFQPSPVVKAYWHSLAISYIYCFSSRGLVCTSGSMGTQIDLMYEWTHFLVFMDIAPDSLVNFSGAPHITIDGSIFSAHQLHSLHFPPWGWDKFLPAFLFSKVVFRSTFTFLFFFWLFHLVGRCYLYPEFRFNHFAAAATTQKTGTALDSTV